MQPPSNFDERARALGSAAATRATSDAAGPDRADRGRDAAHPGDIPPVGWKDVLSRVKRRVTDGNLSITAAGVAFYALIATFPALLALSGLYGLVFDRGEMGEQFSFLQGQLQPEATRLLVALLQGATDEAGRSGSHPAAGARFA